MSAERSEAAAPGEGGAAPVAPSLVLTSQSVPEGPCPNVASPRKVFNTEDARKWFWAPCQAWPCTRCGPARVKQRAAVAAWAAAQHDRTRLITLTQAPEDWQACRSKMKDLKYELGLTGTVNEWAWARERGSKTGMLHVHAIQWGDFIRQDVLQNMWGSIVDIREVKRDPRAATAYVLKGSAAAAGYVLKGAEADYLEWLELNGNRPVHFSRGFLGEGGFRGAKERKRKQAEALGRPGWVAFTADRAPSQAEWQLHLAELKAQGQEVWSVRQAYGWED